MSVRLSVVFLEWHFLFTSSGTCCRTSRLAATFPLVADRRTDRGHYHRHRHTIILISENCQNADTVGLTMMSMNIKKVKVTKNSNI